MIQYPENIEQKLEVNQIRELLKKYCQTEAAGQLVEEAKPLTEFNKLKLFLDQTQEAIHLLVHTEGKLSGRFEDINPLIKRIKTHGTWLDGESLLVLKSGLSTLYEWVSFLSKNNHLYPQLYTIVNTLSANNQLVFEIERIIDERGNIKDGASKELAEIRNAIYKAEQSVRKSIRNILDKVKKDQFSEESSEVTIREGRLVIPVKAEFKRKISGFIHDESSTGQTVFLEPTEVLNLNNEVKELKFREIREIQKILLSLSDLIRRSIPELEKGGRNLIILDFIYAKALFAKAYDAHVPLLQKGAGMNLINGRHTLLQKFQQSQGKKVIPLSIQLRHDIHRILVISGPNAGGKSVAMKTIGLLQYLLQCGFPITADPHSEMGIFNSFFIDMGDEQSLENDLSTYSSRLKAMKYFLDMADSRSLILIDEFGTGTEPQFGGAIAQAILTKLAAQKVFGVITTHYTNIKELAEKTAGMMNAAMRYDTNRLEPMYQLEIGKPGSSFAFEIARKTGLSEAILNQAQQMVGSQRVNYDKLLVTLESDKAKYENLNASLSKKENELKKLRDEYEALRIMLQEEKKSVLKAAKIEAKQILMNANSRVEQTIREIKEHQAEKNITKVLREELKKHQESIISEDKTIKKITSNLLAIGDFVKISGQEGVGQIIDLKGKQAQVSFGDLKSFVAINRLERLSNTAAKAAAKVKIGGVSLTSKMASFSSELDLRGKRAEEAIPILDKYMDEALMLGKSDLRVLHGKGYGIMREIVRNHLSGYKQVHKIEDEHVERGGSGITVIKLAQ